MWWITVIEDRDDQPGGGEKGKKAGEELRRNRAGSGGEGRSRLVLGARAV